METDAARWNRLRTEGRWVELWADVRASGSVDDMLAIDQDLTPEERSADIAARQARAAEPAIQARLSEIGDRPILAVLDRIEETEGPAQRELAEAGRKIALATLNARHHGLSA